MVSRGLGTGWGTDEAGLHDALAGLTGRCQCVQLTAPSGCLGQLKAFEKSPPIRLQGCWVIQPVLVVLVYQVSIPTICHAQIFHLGYLPE